MVGSRTRRVTRLAPLMFLLLSAVAALVAQPGTAFALFSGCRNDPLVWLSDGTRLRVTVLIDTQVEKVRDVHYIIHGPVGTRVEQVRYTGPKGMPERLDFVADGARGVYRADVIVLTIGAPVDVELRLRQLFDFDSDTGQSGELLTTSIRP